MCVSVWTVHGDAVVSVFVWMVRGCSVNEGDKRANERVPVVYQKQPDFV